MWALALRQQTEPQHPLAPTDQLHVVCLQDEGAIPAQLVASFWLGSEDAETDMKAATFIASGKKCSTYVQTSLSCLSSEAASVLRGVRAVLGSSWCPAARTLTDPMRSTLVLLGDKEQYTGLHLDWTEAFNVAFPVGRGVPADAVLAVWVFVAPWATQLADSVIRNFCAPPRERGWVGGLASEPRVHLVEPLLGKFAAVLNTARAGSVVIVEQRARDVVYAPPGWVHQVTNRQACLKVVWDAYDANHYASYALLQTAIAAPLFKTSMVADYMAFNKVAEEVLKGM